MNDWDPMMADYNDSYFNRYSQGVGRNLSSGNRTAAHIFVDNFPVDVGEEGLVNLFSDFGVVLNAELKPSNRPDKKHTFGFVIMADPAGAAQAISMLNGRKLPFNTWPLKVKPAITNEEKGRRKMNKQIERDILGPYSDSDMYSMPDESRIRRPLEYDFPNLRNLAAGFPPGGNRFMNGPCGPGWEMDERESHLSFGRGRHMDQFRGPGPRPNLAGRGQRLHEYISHGPGRGRGSFRPPSNRAPPRVSQTTTIKLCIHCRKEGCTNRCSRCKMHYCSFECQRRDWPNHRNICIDVSLHHQTLYGAEHNGNRPTPANENRRGNKVNSAPGAWPLKSASQKGHLQTLYGDEHNGNRPTPANENRRGNKVDSAPGAWPLKSASQKGEKQQKDQDVARRKNQPSKKEELQAKNLSASKTSENKSKSNGFESDSANTSNKVDAGKKQKNQASRSITNKNSQANDFEKRSPAQTSQSNKDSTQPKNKDDADPSKKKVNQGRQTKDGRQGERDKRDPKTTSEASNMPKAQTENRSQAMKNQRKNEGEKTMKEEKSAKANVVDASGDAPADLACDTLPLNSSVNCYVSSYESPNDIWVTKAENFVPFLETSALFTECIQNVPQVPMSNIKVGDLYCLVYDEVWSRAKVVTVHSDSTATVVFPDFGNKDVVNISDLKPLVTEMLVWPAQAIHCCIHGLKPKQQSAWDEKANEALKKWIGDILTKEFTVTCHAKQGDKYAVGITSDAATPKSLTELLSSVNPADKIRVIANQNGPVKEGKTPVKRFQANELQTVVAELSIGQKMDINIMNFKSAGHFLGQVVDKILALPELEQTLERLNLEEEAPYRPVVGELVLAKYYEDKKWYRSEVTMGKGDNYAITFIDYGNEESVSSDNIRRIQHASVLEFPRFAISFGFHGFDNLSSSNLDEFAHLLEEYTLQTGVWRVVILEKKNSIVFVDFVSENKTQSLSEVLGKKKLSKKDSALKVAASPQPVVSPKTKSPAIESPPNKSKVSESVTPQVSSPVSTESLPLGAKTTTNVTVSYVVSLETFFVRLREKQDFLIEMMKELNNVECLTLLEKAQEGCLATVHFDDLWYRVKIVSVEDETCSVFFVDYGNTETLRRSGLHALPDWLSKVPTHAICCSLDLKSSRFPTDALEQLKLCEESDIHVMVLRKGDNVYVVQLCKHDGSPIFLSEEDSPKKDSAPPVVSPKTKSLASASPPNKSKSSESVTPQVSSPVATESLPVGVTATTNVTVSYVVSLETFFVRLREKQDFLIEMMKELNNVECLTLLEKVQEECLATVHFDDLWYRVKIVSVEDETCSVFFVDYGNTETLRKSSLHALPDWLSKFPTHAICCSLDLKSSRFPTDALEQLKLCEESDIHVRVLRKGDNVYVVQLCKPDGSPIFHSEEDSPKKDSAPPVVSPKTKSLASASPPNISKSSESVTPQVSSPVATESLPVDVTATTNVTVSYVVSLETFFVRLREKQDFLIKLMKELNNIECLTLLEKAQEGCLATVHFDDLWYRVKIVSVEDETCSVFFVDYGNTETLRKSSLHALPDWLSKFPTHAICCSLDLKSSRFPTDALEQLKLCEESDIHVMVLRKGDNVYVVQLCKLDGSQIFHSEENTNAQKKHISTVVTPMLSDLEVKEPTGPDMDVRCVHFEDINEFYCVKVDDIAGLTELSQNLESFYKNIESGFCQEPVLGGLYGCNFESEWYRCVVEEIKGQIVSVRYIDFGNTERRSFTDLKPLDHEFLTVPVSMFRCKLHGIQISGDEENHSGMEEYKNMLWEKLKLHESHITINGKEGKTYLVSLSLSSWNGQSVDVAADLVGVGLARSTSAAQPQQNDEEPDEEEDEDDRQMKELMRQMEELKMRKKNKTAK